MPRVWIAHGMFPQFYLNNISSFPDNRALPFHITAFSFLQYSCRPCFADNVNKFLVKKKKKKKGTATEAEACWKIVLGTIIVTSTSLLQWAAH